MLRGFGDDSAINTLKGKAQALIGQMLIARNKLNTLLASPDPAVKQRAQELSVTQDDLEKQLTEVNTQLNDPNADIGIADYANIGMFLVNVKVQVDAVDTLESGAPAQAWYRTSGVQVGGGLLAAAGLLYLLFGRKR